MKVMQTIAGAARSLWARFDNFITARADRQVNGWAGEMEYKRAYTNPDVAKRYRQPV